MFQRDSQAVSIAAFVGFCTLLAVGAVALVNNDDPTDPIADCMRTPVIVSDLQLVADEKKSAFSKSVLRARPGTIKITVSVPAESNGKHGVGIDGGQYKNIAGAPVLPGRATSLTIAVKPGRYTVFDSYRHNRAQGFRARLLVSKEPGPSEKSPCTPVHGID